MGKRKDRTRAVNCEGVDLTLAPTYCHTIGTPLLQRLAHTTTTHTGEQFSTRVLLEFRCSRDETSVMCGRAMHEGAVRMQMGECTLCDITLLKASSFGLPSHTCHTVQACEYVLCARTERGRGVPMSGRIHKSRSPRGAMRPPASSSIKRSAADARAQALLASPAWPWETQNTVNGIQGLRRRDSYGKIEGSMVLWYGGGHLSKETPTPSNLCMSRGYLL